MLKQKLAKSIYLAFSICFLQHPITSAQVDYSSSDTVRYTMEEAEKTFLEKNLALLAQHYDVEVNKALIQQAKLWDNPTLNTDQNVYSNNKFFEHGTYPNGTPYGQYYIQVQQLIKTAGKRGKQVRMAKTNAEISEWQFKDVMRNLRSQLHQDFYTVAQLQASKKLFADELAQIDRLLTGMNAEFKLGNIAKKDLLRVQALQISLLHDATDNDKQLDDTEAELKTMLQLGATSYIVPVIDNESIVPQMPDVTIPQLMDLAKQNNTTYQLELLQVKYQQQNLAFQKSMAIPDLTLGPNFDKNSNYTPNYVGLGISLPIPALNRNQGNIKSARWQVKEEETNLQQAELELQNSVISAYNKLRFTFDLSSKQHQSFYKDYSELYNNILKSFKDRQISMVEFIDYFDAYKDARQKQLQQILNVQLAKDELNTKVGTDVVK